MTALTLQFAAWSPDLQNFATQIDGNTSTTDIACADCLNVYYADGGYRCLPAPTAIGTALPAACLTAFTYYDNVGASQLIFTGTQDAIYAIDNGVSTLVPIENSATVSVSGWSLNTRLSGTTLVLPFKMTSKLGNVTVSGGSIYSGTLGAATGTLGGSTYIGYAASTFGTLSPASDLLSNAILDIVNGPGLFGGGTPTLSVKYNVALSSTYFRAISFPSLGLTYLTSAATVHANSGLGQKFIAWEWPSPPSFVAGNSYPVKLLL